MKTSNPTELSPTTVHSVNASLTTILQDIAKEAMQAMSDVMKADNKAELAAVIYKMEDKLAGHAICWADLADTARKWDV